MFTHLSSQLHVPALRKSIGRRRRPWIFTFHMVDNFSSLEILESMKRSGWLQQGQCGTEDASGLSHHNYPPAPDKKGHFPICNKIWLFSAQKAGVCSHCVHNKMNAYLSHNSAVSADKKRFPNFPIYWHLLVNVKGLYERVSRLFLVRSPSLSHSPHLILKTKCIGRDDKWIEIKDETRSNGITAA